MKNYTHPFLLKWNAQKYCYSINQSLFFFFFYLFVYLINVKPRQLPGPGNGDLFRLLEIADIQRPNWKSSQGPRGGDIQLYNPIPLMSILPMHVFASGKLNPDPPNCLLVNPGKLWLDNSSRNCRLGRLLPAGSMATLLDVWQVICDSGWWMLSGSKTLTVWIWNKDKKN